MPPAASPIVSPLNAPLLKPSQERLLLFVLASIQFTNIVDFMVMMPLGPQLTRTFAISDARFGALVSAYTLAAGAAGLAASLVIDRFERKRLVLILYAGFALSTLACGLATSYGALMAARITAGAFGGVLGAMVQTIIGDVIPFERRGRAMGVVMGAFSLSTVAGVPGSLWLAEHLGWHWPFIAIAAGSAIVAVLAWRVMPVYRQAPMELSPLGALKATVSEPNHWRAVILSALLMGSSFAIIPYITIYSVSTVGIATADIPLVYLAGGVATFFTARLFGSLTDRWGKVPTFRLVVLSAAVPMLVLTHLGTTPLPIYLVVSTAFFILASGRMVPGMAIVTSAAQPRLRGTFMSLQGCVQSAAMGVASIVGGLLISRADDGRVLGYGRAGWLALAFSLIAVWLVSRVRLHETGRGSAPLATPAVPPRQGSDAASDGRSAP